MLAAAGCAALAAFTLFRPPSTPGPLARDFEAYYAAGTTVNAGGNPYTRAIWAAETRIPGVDTTRDELLPFVGPGATLPMWSLFARLPYRLALTLWLTALLGSCVAIATSALRVARCAASSRQLTAVAVLTLCAAPTLSSLALGQAALVSAAGVAAATVSYRNRQPARALLATLVAAVQPNLAPALTGRLRSRWDIVVAGAAMAVFATFTLAVSGGLGGFALYLRRLAAHGGAERFITIQHTPAAIAASLGLGEGIALALAGAGALAAIIAAALSIAHERLDPTTATLLCCALLPLAVPFFHQQDFVLEVFPLLVVALRARGRARAYGAVAAVLVLVDWFGLAQRHGAAGQIICLGIAVVSSYAALSSRRALARGDLVGIAVLLALTAIALPAAVRHPAPTWPDALPANFRGPAGADAGSLWAAEQVAAGLAAVDPVWGLLRALPLCGCALLAVAIVADARDRMRRRLPVTATSAALSVAKPPVRHTFKCRR